MTQRRKSKKTEAEPRRVNRRTFLAGAGAAACVGAGLWLHRKKFSKRDKTKAEKQSVENPALPAGEWRAVWVSYLEWTAMDFSSADAFRAGCVQMLENCAGLGLNTVLRVAASSSVLRETSASCTRGAAFLAVVWAGASNTGAAASADTGSRDSSILPVSRMLTMRLAFIKFRSFRVGFIRGVVTINIP